MALTKEQNDQLTQTGRGTLLGDLFRRYWIPALLAEEIAERRAEFDRVRAEARRMRGEAGLLRSGAEAP